MAKRAKSSRTKSSGAKSRRKSAPAKKARTSVRKSARKSAAKSAASKASRTVAGAGIVPCLTYRDAPAAIEFLRNAFGFKKKTVIEGEGGMIAHAELTLGNVMVMLGSHKDTTYGKLVTSPREVGICTQTIYLVVRNPDGHHDKAKANGAEIVLPPTTQDYGGRDYTCRDPEGHVWTFGTYNPWA